MRKIRLFYLITGTSVGGAEKALFDLCTTLDKTRYEITVGSLKEKGLIAEQLEKRGVEVVTFGLKEGSGFAGFFSSLMVVFRMAMVVKKKKTDILHTFLFRANLIGRIAARLAGVPVIISSLRTMEEEKRYQLFLERITSFMVDRYIAVSEKVKEHAIRHSKISPDKIEIIYNGVRVNSDRVNHNIETARKELNISPADRVVMAVGRLRREKGHIYLIDAIDEVRKRIPGVKLIIVGEGEEEKSLKYKVKQLSLTERVIFTGVRKDVPALLGLAELVILPSLWEGMPNCLLEAMNAGKPVVATTVGGIPEVVLDGETGILVPPRDSGALGESILKILSRREEAHAMGMRGKKRVVQCFPLEKTIRATEAVYQEILNRKVLLC